MSDPTRTDDLVVRHVAVTDSAVQPMLAELVIEYGTRYPGFSPDVELNRFPPEQFAPPHGAFIVLIEGGVTVAGGALRRYDEHTAEMKRIWTSSAQRRRGLARRVLRELEAHAVVLGYRRVYLTTGPRQPEAHALYQAAGYTALAAPDEPSVSFRLHAFTKELC